MRPRPFFGPGTQHGVGAFGWLVFAVLLAILIVAVVFLVRALREQRGPGAGRQAPLLADQALAELRLRYARGELTREEFIQRGNDLVASLGGVPASGGQRPPPPAPPPPPG